MCDLRLTEHESVPDFIQARFDELTVKNLLVRTNSGLQNMTVRLPKGQVAAIDLVAKTLEMSRQEFLFELMGSALEQAINETAKRLQTEDGKAWKKMAMDTWAAPDFALDDEGADHE